MPKCPTQMPGRSNTTSFLFEISIELLSGVAWLAHENSLELESIKFKKYFSELSRHKIPFRYDGTGILVQEFWYRVLFFPGKL